ncbi:MAG: conjugal transfer protein TraR [Ignavibacteriaceae bacterium]|nr:conjugal transfer protein TraR [Ignavibacteriaceae bacterium]
MAKKTKSKIKSPAKGTKKSLTKGKSKVTKKKTVKKKTSAKKNVTTKKAAAKKVTSRITAATKAKKGTVKKAAPKKKVTTKKTAAKKPKTNKSATKKTSAKTVKKQGVKKEVSKKNIVTRTEALQKIKGYSKKDLEQFRAIILEKRDEILEDLQSLKEQMLDTSTGEYINENSPYSLHMAEQGTDAMEREKTFLYAQRENKFLGYLDDALKRIDNGIYGICIECIEEPQHLCETCPLVPKARLIAVPHTQHCLPIKQRKGGR